MLSNKKQSILVKNLFNHCTKCFTNINRRNRCINNNLTYTFMNIFLKKVEPTRTHRSGITTINNIINRFIDKIHNVFIFYDTTFTKTFTRTLSNGITTSNRLTGYIITYRCCWRRYSWARKKKNKWLTGLNVRHHVRNNNIIYQSVANI